MGQDRDEVSKSHASSPGKLLKVSVILVTTFSTLLLIATTVNFFSDLDDVLILSRNISFLILAVLFFMCSLGLLRMKLWGYFGVLILAPFPVLLYISATLVVVALDITASLEIIRGFYMYLLVGRYLEEFGALNRPGAIIVSFWLQLMVAFPAVFIWIVILVNRSKFKS